MLNWGIGCGLCVGGKIIWQLKVLNYPKMKLQEGQILTFWGEPVGDINKWLERSLWWHL